MKTFAIPSYRPCYSYIQAMLTIVFILLFATATEEKLSNTPYDGFDNHLYESRHSQPDSRVARKLDGDKLWVLQLTDELKDLTLRPGESWEDEEFEEVIGPLRKRLSPRARRGPPGAAQGGGAEGDGAPGDAGEARRDLLRALNRHTISLRDNPEEQLNDPFSDDTSTTITVYTKGNLTMLAMRSCEQAWRYAVPPPPPLPAPLHAPLVAPTDLAALYRALLHVVNTFSYLPM